MLELVVMGQLLVFNSNVNKNNQQKNKKKFNYRFNSKIPLCKNTYLKLVGIKKEHMKNLKKHLFENGLTERIHGNVKKIPTLNTRVTINYDVSTDVYAFLINYSNIHGLPSPGRHMKTDTIPIIYLPTENSYSSVYEDFSKACNELYGDNYNIMSRKSFIRIWQNLTPHIKFMTPGSDLCEICEILKTKIRIVDDIAEKNQLQLQYNHHYSRANMERQYYHHNINICNTLDNVIHICYDWAQNVPIPFSPQQIGSTYFKTAFAANLFGVCNTDQK